MKGDGSFGLGGKLSHHGAAHGISHEVQRRAHAAGGAADGPPALCRGGVVHHIGYGAGRGGRHSDACHGGRDFAGGMHTS